MSRLPDHSGSGAQTGLFCTGLESNDLLIMLYLNWGFNNMYNSKMRALSKLLVLMGALNWGLVGLLNFNLVSALFGKKSIISKLIYTLVGFAGVYLILAAKEHKRMAKLTCWR